MVAALILVALCGYLVGSHRRGSTTVPRDPQSQARVVSVPGLLLEYPIDWAPTRTPASIPALRVGHAVSVSPSGTTVAGLLAGVLPAGGVGPLPAGFLAHLEGVPHTEVVELVSTQAYNYTQLRLRGYHGSLDLFAIPADAGATRILACFAPASASAVAAQCQRIVAGVTPTGSPPPTLTPAPAYGHDLSRLLTGLGSERLTARRQMSDSGSAASVAGVAEKLGSHFSAAAKAVAALEPPAQATQAQIALVGALRRAGEAYAGLSIAAATESLAAYDSARAQVGTAEGSVDAALENFDLLGYGAD